jgi:AraC family transcriptional regulator of adaptative response / DNA-3-methyladenine glycosylase II
MQASPDLSTEQCYPALLARDARFDGRWFVGVTSTGVYCRPICRVRTPKAENCRFFGSAALAEAARFRPCLKCRPELAPRAGRLAWSVMDASRTLALQAAAWLEQAQGSEASMEQLAAHLGISSRHLRRIFMAEHGVTPLQYLQTRRLLLAKQLLSETQLPVAEVAHSAGFGSLRRFNAAFAEQYRLQPSALRRGQKLNLSACGEPRLALNYRPPYAVDALLQFLAARAIPGIEEVDLAERRISRSLRVRHQGAWLAGRVELQFDAQQPRVWLLPCSAVWPAVASLMPALRRWLDLDAEPAAIDTCLGELATAEPGMRLPGCLDRYELAVRAVLGQQVTVAAARTLARRFVERFGEPLPEGQTTPMVHRLFPSPERIAVAGVEEIAELGIIRRRAEALIALARAWPGSRFAAGLGTPAEALAELQAVPGLGPWTAQYMLMRGWSWPDMFPEADVVLRKQLSPPDAALKPREVQQAAAAFAPYRSYAVLQLWRRAALADATRKTIVKA